MTPAELVRADHEMMLIIGAFVTAQQDPASFERFTERLFNEWERRATDEGRAAAGRVEADRRAFADLLTAATHRNAEPPQDTGSSTAATM